MKTRILTSAVTAAAIGLTGCVCGLHRSPSEQPLESRAKVGLLGGSSWTLVELAGAMVNLDSVKAQPFIEFSTDGRLSGMAGCNGMFGVFEADTENLKFDGLGTTKMFCPTGMVTEGRFLDALDRTTHYRVIADTLMLQDSAAARLARFVAGSK
jgi:heat shock protein HslJ